MKSAQVVAAALEDDDSVALATLALAFLVASTFVESVAAFSFSLAALTEQAAMEATEVSVL